MQDKEGQGTRSQSRAFLYFLRPSHLIPPQLLPLLLQTGALFSLLTGKLFGKSFYCSCYWLLVCCFPVFYDWELRRFWVQLFLYLETVSFGFGFEVARIGRDTSRCQLARYGYSLGFSVVLTALGSKKTSNFAGIFRRRRNPVPEPLESAVPDGKIDVCQRWVSQWSSSSFLKLFFSKRC